MDHYEQINTEQIARCRLIVSMIAADGEIAEEEKAFLHRTMYRMGLSSEDMKDALDHMAEEEAEAIVKGLDRIERLDFLNDLAFAAMADGHLDENERAYIDLLAKEMSLDAHDVTEALQRAKAQT
jgi:uncharacterized tellurite resistance protein B-like protein